MDFFQRFKISEEHYVFIYCLMILNIISYILSVKIFVNVVIAILQNIKLFKLFID